MKSFKELKNKFNLSVCNVVCKYFGTRHSINDERKVVYFSAEAIIKAKPAKSKLIREEFGIVEVHVNEGKLESTLFKRQLAQNAILARKESLFCELAQHAIRESEEQTGIKRI